MERNRLGLHSICMDLDISKLMGYFTSSKIENAELQYYTSACSKYGDFIIDLYQSSSILFLTG